MWLLPYLESSGYLSPTGLSPRSLLARPRFASAAAARAGAAAGGSSGAFAASASVEGASEVVYGDIHAAHLQAVQEAADAEARAQKVALKDRVLSFVFAMLTKPTGWIRRRRERDYVVPIGDGVLVDEVADEKVGDAKALAEP